MDPKKVREAILRGYKDGHTGQKFDAMPTPIGYRARYLEGCLAGRRIKVAAAGGARG